MPGRSPEEFADAIGGDVRYLLQAVKKAEDLELFRLPEIEQLHQVWLRQYDHTGKGLEWRATECAFCVYGNADCGGANTSRYRYSSQVSE